MGFSGWLACVIPGFLPAIAYRINEAATDDEDLYKIGVDAGAEGRRLRAGEEAGQCPTILSIPSKGDRRS